MALKIRLSRGGSKKRPFYKVVIADSRSPRDGRFIEKVGHFNPLLPKDNPDRLKLDLEKIKEWIGKGAKPTEKLERFLGEAKVVPMPVQKNNPKKALPKKKAQERLAALKEAEEAAVAEAEAPAAEAEAPAAEAEQKRQQQKQKRQQQKQKRQQQKQKRQQQKQKRQQQKQKRQQQKMRKNNTLFKYEK